LFAWGAFSVVYYGFPWPNTAYAKLGSGIPPIESLEQGLRYLFESLRHDPLTLIAIAAGVYAALRRRDPKERALAAGVVLYLLWVVKNGGDFMSGRFLTAPLFVAAAILVRGRFGSPRWVSGLVAATIVVGSVAPRAATWDVGFLDLAKEHAVDAHGIADERAFYLPTTGIALRWGADREFNSNAIAAALEAKAAGPAVVRLTDRGCGMYGYFAGPTIHVVDEWALGDPLLARLPAARNLHWRIGHFTRAIPDGYLETLRTGRNQLRDPELAAYWDRLSTVVRAPVFAVSRWKALVGFGLGGAAPSGDPDRWRLPNLVEVDAAEPFPSSGHAFDDSGIEVRFDPPSGAARVALGLEGGTEFSVEWRRGTRVLASTRIQSSGGASAESIAVEVPAAARRGFDCVRLLPLLGDGSYRLTVFRPEN
jgi:arabinofuranosyltransferase